MKEHKCCDVHRIDRTSQTRNAGVSPAAATLPQILQNAPRSTVFEYVHSNTEPTQAIQLLSRPFLRNTISNPFSVVKAAGINWFKHFTKLRSDKLSLRQPTTISNATTRATGFNRQQSADAETNEFICDCYL